MAKMQAAMMYGPNDIRVEMIDRPLCPEGGFVLKVDAVGLCGSDIRNLTTDSRQGEYPFLYGHEIVGTIVESDNEEFEFNVGDQIYVYPEAHCLKCENCRSGHHESCTEVESYTEHPGGFAEYISYTKKRVERGAMYKIPEGVNAVRATLAEPMSSTYACAENINITLGDNVVIAGAGPIGVFLVILAKMRGAEKIIVIDLNDERLKETIKFGATHIINGSKEDAIKKVLDFTDGKGAHKVITANPSVKSQEEAIYMTKRGGTIAYFGGVPKGDMATIDSNFVHYNNLWIYGHYGANSIQVQKAFELALSDRFPSEDIITHILPLSEINKGLELVKKGEALKVVLIPGGK